MNTNAIRLGLLAAMVFTSAVGRAQSVNATAGRFTGDHYLLGESMTGGGVSFNFRTPDKRLNIRLGFDTYAGRSGRVGSPCGGFVEPSSCKSEPMRDEASLYLASVGPSYNIIREADFTLSVIGLVQGGRINADSYGIQTGQRLSASKMLWGASGGMAAAWRPDPKMPFAFNAAAETGRLGRIQRSGLMDAYTPFENSGFRTSRLSVGVSYLISR